MSLIFLFFCVATAQETVSYLSNFGADSNDCATATSACRTLPRALAAAKAASGVNKVVQLDSGVISLASTTIDFAVTIRGAGRTLSTFGCSTSAGSVLINVANPANTVLRFVDLGFDSCARPLDIGYGGGVTTNRTVEITNVLFRNCDGAMRFGDGVNYVKIANSHFTLANPSTNEAMELTGTSSSVAAHVTIEGATVFDAARTLSSGYVIDMSSSLGQRSLTIRSGVQFGGGQAVSGANRAWIQIAGGSLKIDNAQFFFQPSTLCGVSSTNTDVTVTGSRFQGARGSSAFCVLGANGVAQISDATFEDNESNSTTVPGGAITLKDAQLAIQRTRFTNNRATGTASANGIGGAISCNNGRLTVRLSTFTGNSARDSAVAACTTCPIVFDGNFASGNTENATTKSCEIISAGATALPPTPSPTAAGPSPTPAGGNNGTPSPGGNNGTPSPGGNNGTPSPGGNNGTPSPGGNNGTPSPGGNNGTPSPGNETPAPGGNNGTAAPGGNSETSGSGPAGASTTAQVDATAAAAVLSATAAAAIGSMAAVLLL